MKTRVFMAAALLLISLGMPWDIKTGQSQATTAYHPGYIVGGICTTHQTWDGWYETECPRPTVNLGFSYLKYEHTKDKSIHGAAHHARFGIVGGLVLLVMGWRLRRPRYFTLAAGWVAMMSVLTVGLDFGYAGATLAWLAVLILVSMARSFKTKIG
jgi:hypothetical protein